jgi:SAM-dependent methyltransferase
MGKDMVECRSSGTDLEVVLDLGRQPLGNGFRSPGDWTEEVFFDLKCGFSEDSCLFQLIEQPPAEEMFHDDYAFKTGTSGAMVRHFTELASKLADTYSLEPDASFVVELGSNDGTFLKPFAQRGVRHLGVEPSANVAEMSRDVGVRVLTEFFSPETAAAIVSSDGNADLIYAANVMCHIDGIRGVAQGMSNLLSDRGVVVFEDPYLGSVLEKNSYDQIYDEHVFLFSALSVQRIFAPFGLQLIDAELLPVHGGSMRYTLAKSGNRQPSPAVDDVIRRERDMGMHLTPTYHAFARRVAESGRRLHQELERLAAAGTDVVAFGATSKSTTVYNYSNVGPELIRVIFDNTPSKQGRLSPGVHIPVVPDTGFLDSGADVAFLGAWNHKAEVFEQTRAFTERGGRWLTHVPEVELVDG